MSKVRSLYKEGMNAQEVADAAILERVGPAGFGVIGTAAAPLILLAEILVTLKEIQSLEEVKILK
jgi:hypothetical protein